MINDLGSFYHIIYINCNSNQCWCKKYYLNYSNACKCLNCANVAETTHSYEQVADSDFVTIWS